MRDARTSAVILPVVGGLLVLGALASFIRQHLRFRSWIAAEGTLVGHRVRQSIRDGRRRTYYHPIVRFEAAGREWVHESQLSTSEKRREEGSRVAMLYDPANPESACINDAREKYFLAMFLGAMGAIFSTVGLLLAR